MAKTNTVGKVFAQAQSTLRLIDPAQLIINPDNERDLTDVSEGIEALYQSIKSEGLMTPIQIFLDGVVHDGNRRLTVINRLQAEGHVIHGTATRNGKVLALVVERHENAVEATIARLNTNEARQFSSLAQARSFAFLRDKGLSNSAIAKRTPFTAMHIGNMLTLADAGDAVHHVIRENQISATLAVETLRKYGEDVVLKAVDLALRAGKDRATGRHVDEIVAGMPKPEIVEVVSVPATAVSTEVVPFEVDIPEVAEGEVAEGEVAEGEVAEGEVAEGEVAEGEVAEGEVAEGEVAEGEVVEGEVVEGEVANSSAKKEKESSKSTVEASSNTASTYKFTADVAKSLLLNFLPYAKRRLAGDVSDEDFNVELELLVKELADYGVSAA